ncbi:copper resistance protein CopC [Nonomuraea phyllanthi]|uniref:copper resistance CopC family protein n=1 Tax=Nonomuraea phyllanthi TaxID=2219224 RepID=UPI001292EB9F|nr:copper resistance CopC family protein [Nonomuraea phyllanthi]QFY08115.1 copper resistance protein CopC [Nonomuraea phyllanthi]
MNRSPLAALTAVLAALLVLVTAAPALAHDALKSSSPAKGTSVEALDEVRLEFTAGVRQPFVIVRGAGDAQHQRGKPEVDGKVVTQAVEGPLPDGEYTIAYRVVSSDGHPIEDEIPFTVKGASPASPSDGPPASESAASESAASAPPSPAQASPGEASPADQAVAADEGAAADQASAEQDVTFPVWLVIVIGALIGIGIGFLLSARRRKP